MNHYCTYFDAGFLTQGLAMTRSLVTNDPDAVVWVLALDEATEAMLRHVGGAAIRPIGLAQLEHGDAELSVAKQNRSRVEYYFTFSAAWPRWLLAQEPAIDRVTYVDADFWFFSSPQSVFSAMDTAGASVLITAHRFAPWQRHYLQHGTFNVGVLSFRRDAAGLRCLDTWRAQCLAWCYDRVEDGKYADQGYLDAWPRALGPALLVLEDRGVNLAPWNWMSARLSIEPATSDRRPAGTARAAGSGAEPGVPRVLVDGRPLVAFHFARLRPLCGAWWWQSGQLDYGVMPWKLRQAIYGPYVRALLAIRRELAHRQPSFDFARRPARLGRDFWRSLPLRWLFGSDWLFAGGYWWGGRFGLGRWSGRALARARRWRSR